MRTNYPQRSVDDLPTLYLRPGTRLDPDNLEFQAARRVRGGRLRREGSEERGTSLVSWDTLCWRHRRGRSGRFQQDTVGLLGESLAGNAKRVLLTFCGLVAREAWCSNVTADPGDYCVFLRDTLGVLLPKTRCAGIRA